MTNIYNLFKFLEDKKGKPIPLRAKLTHAPETIEKEDLNVKGSFDLRNTKISSLPDNLKVGGYLDLSYTSITSIPNNLKVGGSLFLRNTPLTKKYSEKKIRKMIEKKGGEVKGEIYT